MKSWKCEELELRQWRERLNFSEPENFLGGEEEQRNPKVFSFSPFERRIRRGAREKGVSVTLLMPVSYSDFYYDIVNTVLVHCYCW